MIYSIIVVVENTGYNLTSIFTYGKKKPKKVMMLGEEIFFLH